MLVYVLTSSVLADISTSKASHASDFCLTATCCTSSFSFITLI